MLTQKLEAAQAAYDEISERCNAAATERMNLLAHVEKQVEPQVVAVHRKWKEIDEARSLVRRLEQEVDELNGELHTARAAFDDELNAITIRKGVSVAERKKAFLRLSVAHFEIAQSELNDAAVIEPTALARELDARIKSKRTFPERHTLGCAIVWELRKNQTEGGLHEHHLEHVRTHNSRAKKRNVALTAAQAKRAWAYLVQVCPVRGDDGLAPPFKMVLECH